MQIKFPDVLTVLFIIMVAVASLTWFVPTGYYAVETFYTINEQEVVKVVVPSEVNSHTTGQTIPGTYETVPPNYQGIFSVLMAPAKGFYQAQEIIFLVLIIGGFINLAMHTQAINNGIIALMYMLKGSEIIIIPILMSLFALGGTSYGMGEEALGLYPILIPVMLKAGYDSMTAAATIILGCGVGVMGSTINPFATALASSSAGISVSNGLIGRVFILITGLIIAVVYVMMYANRVKKDITSSIVYDTFKDDSKHFLHGDSNQVENRKFNPTQIDFTYQQKLILSIFIFAFIVMIYSLIPFNEMGITMLPTLGWDFTQVAGMFIGMSIIVGLVAGMSESEFIDIFIAGAKDMIGVAIVIGMARGIKIIMVDGAIADTILFWAEQGLSGLSQQAFIVFNYLMHLVLSFFIPSSSGLASFSVPIIAPMADLVNVDRSLIVTGYQIANGLVNLISPTSFILMSSLVISRISLNKWIKFVLPLIGMLLLQNILILLILN